MEALGWLLAARIALMFVPFPRLAEHFGTLVSPAGPLNRNLLNQIDSNHALIAARVGLAVTRVARHAPFKALCLPQAIAAHRMLRRRGVGSVVHFGAAKRQITPLNAHAWVDAAGVEVTGHPVGDHFTEIARFV